MTGRELQAFRAGEEGVFQQAVTEHSPRLTAYALGYTSDLGTAQDLVQETWLRAYRSRQTLQGSGSLLGWLLAILRSIAIDHLRRSERDRQGATRAATLNDRRDVTPPAAIDRVECSDRARRLQAALAELPPRQRDTVVMRILEDRTVRETAQAMECAEGTVKAALKQALNNLRAILHQPDKENG